MSTNTIVRGLDITKAVKVTFVAKLAQGKATTTAFSSKYDHLWCTGHHDAVGPKGGVYFLGRAVMGKAKDGTQVKGMLKLANSKFLAFKAGGTVDAWFTRDGASKAELIGVLSEYAAR